MINQEVIRDFLQNKNSVMLMTSLVFMFGILTYFNSHEILFAFLISGILVALCLFRIFTPKRTLILILVFYFAFFLTSYKIKTTDDLLALAPMNSNFVGRIISVPNSAEEGKVKFMAEIRSVGTTEINAKSFVTVTGDNTSKLLVGDTIEFKGSLRAPFKSTNPSQFDYSAYLKNYNIFTVIYCNNDEFKILKEKLPLKWRFMRFLNKERVKILKIHAKYLKSPNLEILGGIVFGDDAVAPPDYIKKSFINSGLLHILAASGMNVGFIFAFWLAITRRLKIKYKACILSGMFVVILYTLMTGLGPSVIRAALMLLFVLAGKLIDRDAHSISLLSLVAVLMLIYNPAFINNVSFQLSFVVTLGLVTSANVLFSKLAKIPVWIRTPVIIPLVAQIWVAPIQMFYFNTLSVYSIFANILSSCVLSVISFCGFVSSVLAMFKPIANIVCQVFDFFNNYLLNIIVWISDFFSNLPNCLVQTSHPAIYQMILYYVMIISLTYLIKYDKYKHALISFACLSLILVCTTFRIENKNLEITAFDVGNADSFMIKTPQNKYFFIDTGKAPYKSGNSQAKIIMLKYLKDYGIKNVESLIVTHFDSDHSGGASDFIENVKVGNLYLTSRETSTATAKNIFRTAKQSGQKITIAKNNEVIYSESDLTIKTFKSDIGGENASNESSIITLLSYKDFDMLFMADAGIKAFENIKNDLPHDVEVLKVGHHGGPHVVNDDMIKYLGTKVSVISTGINYFGHPNRGTLDILRNTKILRTDLLNCIKISTDGAKHKIYSYDPHSKRFHLKEKF